VDDAPICMNGVREVNTSAMAVGCYIFSRGTGVTWEKNASRAGRRLSNLRGVTASWRFWLK